LLEKSDKILPPFFLSFLDEWFRFFTDRVEKTFFFLPKKSRQNEIIFYKIVDSTFFFSSARPQNGITFSNAVGTVKDDAVTIGQKSVNLTTIRISQLPFSAARGQYYKTFYCGNVAPFHVNTVSLCYKALLHQESELIAIAFV